MLVRVGVRVWIRVWVRVRPCVYGYMSVWLRTNVCGCVCVCMCVVHV